MTQEWGDRERIATVSKQLVNNLADLQDSLSLKSEQAIRGETPELVAVKYSSEALIAFADGSVTFQTANPRFVREQDRRKILPGQHSGAYLQLQGGDFSILKVNFWGGLRMVGTADLRDRDLTLKTSHVFRTDKILEQPVHLNWQLSLPNGPEVDCWIVHNQKDGLFQLSALQIDKERIDINTTITKRKDPSVYNKLRAEISSSIRDLTMLIPSSV